MVFATIGVGFAAIWIGLLRFEDWRIRRTPANKLTFGTANVAFDVVRNSEGNVATVNNAQFILGGL